jgi:single-stranded-DNA-specific exonuclease
VTQAHDRAFTIEPYEYGEARALADGLGLSEPIAVTLVRRGYRTTEQARDFLEAAESHDPREFEGMEEVVSRLIDAVESGRRITVHGDYDVDGVCSTTILVGALRELGAKCDWWIPDRLGDGYGLTAASVSRLAARGTELLLTADCGIGCPDEVAAAREAGLDVIVTDHHVPGDRLPECSILHPRLSGYPCPDLCATGVAYKLATALRTRTGAGIEADRDLDLVALATVADLVPLTGENRSLVRRGLAEARRANRPGLRALMAVARVEPSRLDEGDLAFRIGPRINAAGRLYRADAGVELMLTDSEDRAVEIAAELDRANLERRGAELEVLAGAERALRQLPGELADAPALVLAGSGWHPGVVGIVASRLVERQWRPVVLISIDEDGMGKGSGRSIPAFDLLAALRECGHHLVGFGGHRAAAGVRIEAERIEEFRREFVERARAALDPADLVRTERVDAVVGGDRLGLRVAEELERLAPFGMGNPDVRLLVPAARFADVRPMGDEGKHARFSIESGAARALGVVFGSRDVLGAVNDEPVDALVRLELNHWNGAVEPRVVLQGVYPVANGSNGANGADSEAGKATEGRGCPGCHGTPDDEWWERLDAERTAPLRPWPAQAACDPGEARSRSRIDHAASAGIATLAELVSNERPVLAVCADASRRRGLAERADPARFGPGRAKLVCARCSGDAIEAAAREVLDEDRGLVLADWGVIVRRPELARGFEHVVLVDPPPFPHVEALATRGPGYVHVAWGDAELEFALKVHDAEWSLRAGLATAFVKLREAGGELRDDRLAALLMGEGPHPRTAEQGGRCVRVLTELGLAAWQPDDARRTLRVVSSEHTELERSSAYVAYGARHQEGRRFLSRQRRAR